MIPLFKVFMSPEAKTDVGKVLDSGYIGEGSKVQEFEQALSFAFGMDVLTVNSATSALDIAMHMVGADEDEAEIITTPITCTATNSPAHNKGARLVWADVDPITGVIDPSNVARKITKRTKAIIGVNWSGTMPDYKALKSHGIPVIEDAAHGPYWSNQERGDYVIWSFQAIKHLTAGDGGGIHSPDQNRVRLLRWFGLDRLSSADFRCAQNIQEIGYKYHMNDINATIGLVNIKHMRRLIELHNRNALVYDTLIKNEKITKPVYNAHHPYWLYTVLTEDRDRFIEYLKEHGIASSMVHARNDKHDGFTKTRFKYSNPGVEAFDNHQVSIPVGWWLTYEDVHYIVDVVNNW